MEERTIVAVSEIVIRNLIVDYLKTQGYKAHPSGGSFMLTKDYSQNEKEFPFAKKFDRYETIVERVKK